MLPWATLSFSGDTNAKTLLTFRLRPSFFFLENKTTANNRKYLHELTATEEYQYTSYDL